MPFFLTVDRGLFRESPLSSSLLDLWLSLILLFSVFPLQLVLEIPHVGWEDIGGQWDIKQKLKEAIEWPLQVRDHPNRAAGHKS